MAGPLGRAGGVAHVTVCFTVGVKRMHPYIASQYMYKNSNVKSNMSICVFENMSSYVRTNV